MSQILYPLTMNFIDYTNAWVKAEVNQGKIMIGVGLLVLVALFAIFKSQNELLRGMLIPLGLLTVVLIGYGVVIMTSRPAHAKESLALYELSKSEALEKEKLKHINDNKAGKTLMKYVYPALILLSVFLLLFLSITYYKGMALGFIIVFVSTYIMDYGFVSRSDAFISFINNL